MISGPPDGPQPGLPVRRPQLAAMKTLAALSTLLLCVVAQAQGDTVTMTSGTVVDGCNVQSFNIRELKYSKGGSVEQVPTDQVAKIELKKFKDVYRRSLANKDADLMLTEARNQFSKSKDLLMAQIGYLECARLFYAQGNDGNGGGVLEELSKNIPDAGVLPDGYRMKFENYLSQGDAAGVGNAKLLAQKYSTEATANAWPNGFAVEADYFAAMAEGAGGGDAKAFQAKMRDIVAKAQSGMPILAARANVQLANSLRMTGAADQAAEIYQSILGGKVTDENALAGAHLGIGYLAMGKGDAANREIFRDALMSFLRVRLETRNCSSSPQAEALYNAVLAAEKWGGPDFRLVQGRCRYLLNANFAQTEWAQRARGQ